MESSQRKKRKFKEILFSQQDVNMLEILSSNQFMGNYTDTVRYIYNMAYVENINKDIEKIGKLLEFRTL